jgi:hypothetical protein
MARRPATIASASGCPAINPKLRLVQWVIPALTWSVVVAGGWLAGYFRASGMGAPMRSKASRWWLVGWASIGTVAVAPANWTWLRVRLAR